MNNVQQEQRRGMLTPRVQDKAVQLFGFEISQKELRLLPYIQFTVMNSAKMDPQHVNAEEMVHLSEFVKRGWITGGVTERGRPMLTEPLTITYEFWKQLNEILWLSYVEITERYEKNA